MKKSLAINSLWMLVAGFFFAIMGVCVKLGSAQYSTAELVFYRSVFGFIAIFIITSARRLPLATTHLPMHLSRSINGFIALMLFFYAITSMPLATAVTLNYTSPIFLAIFTAILLREKVKPLLLAAILIGFVGVALLLNPDLQWGIVVKGAPGLVSGILTGLVYIQVTQLGRKGEPEWRTVFYFSMVCTIGSGVWMLFNKTHPVTLSSLPLLIGLGSAATIAQLAMTRAYGTGNYLITGSLAYSTVLFACAFDILLWQEKLTLTNWIAIFLIVGSGVLSFSAIAHKATAPVQT